MSPVPAPRDVSPGGGEATPRLGDWQETFTGRQFWAMDPRPDEIAIEDIAHALSLQCRYGGHCQRFYSVAEHCVLLSEAASPENALWALLHDATEAYLVDVPRPVKRFLAGYRETEDRLMAAICERFGLDPVMPAEVKAMDTAILSDERRQNMSRSGHAWSTDSEGIGVTLRFLTPQSAEVDFLMAFHALSRVTGAHHDR